MHFTSLVIASLALVPCLINAHGDGIPGAPRIFGRRSSLGDIQKRQAAYHDLHGKRQDTDGECGPGLGTCADGYCCSEAGWCGQGSEYCSAPGCQFNFGPACDDNIIPSGTSTSTVARPKLGSVPYGGAGIYDCTVPGTVAITFDDGPYIYTDHILDVLQNYSAKATFFITGNNNGKGEIDNAAYPWAATIKRAYSEGHQIASHTWTHPYLSNLTTTQRRQNMYSNEMALRNILGFFPTYMRPPYSDCTADSGCESDMDDLGYHVTYFDVDTDDYDNDSPALIQNAKNNFDAGIAGGNPSTDDYLVIAHDIHNQTANVLTAYMLERVLALGYKPVTVGECLDDPEENWYRSSPGQLYTSATSAVTSATKTSATILPTATSTDGTCSGGSGFSCAGSEFGNCCSQAGWCGSGALYCGEGCQAGFGSCGINLSQSSSTSSTAPVSAPTGISPDATCGGTSGFTCQGSAFGNCCSTNFWCGSTAAYCGDGCQADFGSCGDVAGVVGGAGVVQQAASASSTLATSAVSRAVTSSKAATVTTTATRAT